MAVPTTLGNHVASPPIDGSVLAECGCRPPGDPKPRYVEVNAAELKRGWECPH